MFTLAQPYKGRAIPVHVGLYSQATLEAEGTSRNGVWRRLLREALEAVEPGSVWVFDREFSFGGWLAVLEGAGVRYAIRLNARGKAYVEDEAGRRIPLQLGRGERRAWTGVYYRTEGSKGGWRVNVVGVWEASWEEPLWGDGEPAGGGAFGGVPGGNGMKIEEAFRDLKSYLGMGNLMNTRRDHAAKTLWLLAFAYALGLLSGESWRGRWQRERGGLVGASGGTTPG
ncbi:MAG: hypothetical protein ABDH20_12860 [Thermus sp.]